MRHLLSTDDLDDGEVGSILDRAAQFEAGVAPATRARGGVAALCFYSSSLRTRVGYATAAHRVGLHPIDVFGSRFTEAMSAPESFEDTIRTLGGMVEVVVGRTPFPVERERMESCSVVPYVNGGDTAAGHPTQALIDLFAMRRHGVISEMAIGIVGDLTSRTVRSLVELLSRNPPKRLMLFGPDSAADVSVTGTALAGCTERHSRFTTAGLDVLYLAGLPQTVGTRHLDAQERAGFALDSRRAVELPPSAIVLSPLPVIDELDPQVRDDPRISMFEQSDAGLFIRMAVLEHVVQWSDPC